MGTVATNVTINDYAPDLLKSFPENNKLIIKDTNNNFWLLDESETITSLVHNSLAGAIEFGNKAILPFNNEKNGQELFQYDFSTNKLDLYFDANHKVGSNPKNFRINNLNELIFTANDYEHGNEFYSIKNKGGNPLLIKDFISTGSDHDSHYGIPEGKLFKVGNYFYVQPNSYTGDLARTSGTETETKILKIPLVNNTIDQYSSFGNLNENSLLFTTYDSSPNPRVINLWKVDNNSETVNLIKSIPTGVNVPSTTKTVLYDGYVFFTVENGNYEQQIWKTDGTAENTKLAFQITSSPYYSNVPKLIQVFDNKLLVQQGNQLWAYENATNVLSQILIGDNFQVNISDNPEVIDGKLYLLTQFGYGKVYKFENLQTQPIALINNATGSFSKFIKSGNNIYFASGTADNSYNQLWAIDPDTNTANNIVAYDTSGNNIKSLTNIKNYLYFLKDNSIKIWKTDGTISGLSSLDLNINNSEQLAANDKLTDLTSFNEKLYFVGQTAESGTELFYVKTELPLFLSTAETNGSTQKIKLILYPNPASDFIKIKNNFDKTFKKFTIYDTSGKTVKSGKYENEDESIDISSLNKGIYIIEVRTNGNVFSQKFIKK